MKMKKWVFVAVALAAAIALAGCPAASGVGGNGGGGDPGGDNGDAAPAELTAIVLGGPQGVAVGGTITVVAAALPANTLSGATITWASSNAGVATVSGGVVTGVAPGTTEITASVGGITSAPRTITVAPAGPPVQFPPGVAGCLCGCRITGSCVCDGDQACGDTMSCACADEVLAFNGFMVLEGISAPAWVAASNAVTPGTFAPVGPLTLSNASAVWVEDSGDFFLRVLGQGTADFGVRIGDLLVGDTVVVEGRAFGGAASPTGSNRSMVIVEAGGWGNISDQAFWDHDPGGAGFGFALTVVADAGQAANGVEVRVHNNAGYHATHFFIYSITITR